MILVIFILSMFTFFFFFFFFFFIMMQILSTIYFEGGLPFPFLNLRTLEVRTGRLSKIEIPAIVCLLKNAPLLDTLKLEISYSLSSTGSDKVSIKLNLIEKLQLISLNFYRIYINHFLKLKKLSI
jgi:hypothetical protein